MGMYKTKIKDIEKVKPLKGSKAKKMFNQFVAVYSGKKKIF